MYTLIRYRVISELGYRVAVIPGPTPINLSLVWRGERVRESDLAESYVFPQYNPDTHSALHPVTKKWVMMEGYL